jgi:hypothetical protein
MQNNVFFFTILIFHLCLLINFLITFSAGLSTGCFMSLFCVYAILAHLCHIFSPNNESAYMEIVYPVFRYKIMYNIYRLTIKISFK